MKSIPRHILILAVATVLISLAYAFYWHDRPRVDSAAYDQIGWNLAQGLGYVEEAQYTNTPEQDWAPIRVGPGYQFFLALVYKVFGHTVWMVWVLHALLRGVSVILIWLIVTRLFPTYPHASVIAAGLFAFTPDLVVASGLLLTETLFIAVFLGALVASFRMLEQKHSGIVVATTVLWALAILIRPTALLAFGFLLLLLCWKREWRTVSLAIIVALVIIGPWSYAMTQRYGRFILTTSVGSYDLWVGNHSGAKGGFEKSVEIQQARDSMSMLELDRVSRENYWRFVRESPAEFLLLQVKKSALYFSLLRPTGFWIHLSDYPIQRLLTLVASGMWTAILFILGIAGFVLLVPRILREIKLVFLSVIMLLQPIAVIPIIVESRYRFVLYPLLAIFAALWASSPHSTTKRRALLISLVFFGGMTLLDIVFHGVVITRRLQDAFTMFTL